MHYVFGGHASIQTRNIDVQIVLILKIM